MRREVDDCAKGKLINNLRLGIGHTTLEGWNSRDRKSLSNETTFRDTSDNDELHEICTRLSQDLAEDLERESLTGRAVTLKIKTDKFKIKTRLGTTFFFQFFVIGS